MKKVFFLAIFILQLTAAFTQSVGVGTSSPEASAQLDISSATKGLLIPRMTTQKIGSVSSPAKGLLIYDSTLNQLMINGGTKQSPNWQQVNNKGWSMMGNNGTDATMNFIGTTDNSPLLFRMNNRPAGMLDSSSQSTFFGYRSGGQAIALAGNSVFGYAAGLSNTTGIFNSAVGAYALNLNTTGSYNSALGRMALFNNTTGNYNTAIGVYTLQSNTTGYSNIAVGAYASALNTTGNNNTAIGYYALFNNTIGTHNTSVGTSALQSNNTGSYNTGIGTAVLAFNTSGSSNSAFGTYALNDNTTGTNNTATGYGSLTTNINGSFNTANGDLALRDNTTGSNNVAVGSLASQANTTGSGNTAIGCQALNFTTASFNNTALGYKAGNGFNNGWNNTFIGAESYANGTGLYNCVALGNGATTTGSSQARIGNSSTYSIGGFANWTNISDGRYKTNIREDVSGLAFIMKLRPVTYQLDISSLRKKLGESTNPGSDSVMSIAIDTKQKMIQSGFIAQEVEKSAAELGYDFSGVDKPKNDNDLYGLRYAEFVVPLVKGMQEQQQTIQSQQAQINELKKVIEQLLLRIK